MLSNDYCRPVAWLLCFGSLLVGCNSSEPLVDGEPIDAASAEPSTNESAAKLAGSESSAAPREPELAAAVKPIVAAAEFVPPFPDRLELFEPPKRAEGTVRRNDEHGETVELKGFIHVDQPRVVLSIDGVVSPIAAGGEKFGVHVIAITPPSVVLQRGRDRWTATLE